MDTERTAQEIGGDLLIAFFDAIWAQQRKRWNAPDWRTQKLIEADLINWRDVTFALRRVRGY